MDWYPTTYSRQRLLMVIVVALIVAGTGAACFYLGAHMVTENTNVIEQGIYNHGYIVGFAAGINQSNTQCDQKLRSLHANCNSWEVPPERLGINLTAGGT